MVYITIEHEDKVRTIEMSEQMFNDKAEDLAEKIETAYKEMNEEIKF